MSEIVSIANQKGGVGKTTTSINLAYALAVLGHETLLVDFDPQGNATSGVGLTLNEGENTIYNLVTKTASFDKVIKQTSNELLDILPANRELAGAEVELVSVEDRERVLKNILEPLRKMYKYIIIDCPPSLSLLTLNALVASDSVITPIQCEYYAMEGLAHFIDTASKIRQFLNPDLKIDGGLLTMYDSRINLSNQVLAEVNKFYGDKVYKTPIPRNVRLAEAPSFGQSIFDYDPGCRGADSYLNLALEFLQRRGVDISQYKDFKLVATSVSY